ncbi:uncharacterized protein LOC128739303 [Sabethes cyaneus]|uniref:uncharacterized protein LOC128739303 n=1 Tax=Sabethes cyaneus TaxID=53552 RepID=UPI00237D74C1|nr:uncharacterized protein LOC128739303 [Sabethes cyaneus]
MHGDEMNKCRFLLIFPLPTPTPIRPGTHFLSTAARAKIIGSQEVHVKKGSTISLSCVVNVHASSISWYHGSSVVDFDSARGGISLETEKTEGGTSSRLMLTRATLRDSGNYTCVPTAAISASVQVHVLNGEHPAAMQTSSGRLCCPASHARSDPLRACVNGSQSSNLYPSPVHLQSSCHSLQQQQQQQ